MGGSIQQVLKRLWNSFKSVTSNLYYSWSVLVWDQLFHCVLKFVFPFVARFLEFDMLAQLSEDIIIDSLTVEILPSVLKWATCPHGSAFVRRQAMLFLREEFVHLINAPSFLDLSRSTLVELAQSDFLQVSKNAVKRYSERIWPDLCEMTNFLQFYVKFRQAKSTYSTLLLDGEKVS